MTNRAAMVNSQIACALIELEAMKAANVERERRGEALAYGEEEIRAIVDRFGIGWNSVVALLRGH